MTQMMSEEKYAMTKMNDDDAQMKMKMRMEEYYSVMMSADHRDELRALWRMKMTMTMTTLFLPHPNDDQNFLMLPLLWWW